MEKRKSCRAIIFSKGKMVTMYREKNNRIYYTFPGGGVDEKESNRDCIVREVFEEFGIRVNPIKNVYFYEDESSIQYFFLCEWVDGIFGTGQGEEFQGDASRGVYIPKLIDIEKLDEIPLMPPQIAKQLIDDIQKFGCNLGDDLIEINVK